MKSLTIAIVAGLLALASAQTLADSGAAAPSRVASNSQPAGQDSPAPLSVGTVKKVDRSAGKITIAHGPLENLGMPAMTMTFPVTKATMLDQVKVGDTIRFRAIDLNGAIVVTALERAK